MALTNLEAAHQDHHEVTVGRYHGCCGCRMIVYAYQTM